VVDRCPKTTPDPVAYPGVFLFEDGRGENPDEWTKLAAEFPTNLAAKYAR
jgi:hypothetical protein